MAVTFKIHPLMTAGLIPTVLLTTTPASAELLPPGGFASDFASSLTERPDFGGTVEQKAMIPFTLTDDSGQSIYSGELMHEVVRDTKSGTLSFYYQFINSSNDVFGVQDLITSSFEQYEAEVAILTDHDGETAPIDALRSDDGSAVTFEFDSLASRVAPDGTSFLFLVKTNATNYDRNGITDIHAFTADSLDEGSQPLGSGGAQISTFRPIAAGSNGGGGGSVAVPLPPPVWTAIPTMFVSALYMGRMRKRAGRG